MNLSTIEALAIAWARIAEEAVARHITSFDGRKVIKEVATAVKGWRGYAAKAGMTDKNLINEIEQTHRLYLADDLL